MGKGVGLDFSNGNPVVIGTAMQDPYMLEEGCASIANEAGKLLFYSNGTQVWDSTHNLMPHGSTIMGPGKTSVSTTQGAVIVPDPANSQRYFLFSLTATPYSKLFCNVIDMTLNNGLGDVDTTYVLRHVILADSLSEKMVSVSGCQQNVWVVVRSYYDNYFKAYEITTTGVDISPVISVAGNFPGPVNNVGVLKINNARNKLLSVNTNGAGLELYDFDYNTGLVSNTQTLESGSSLGSYFYGGAFSPDDSKVYVQQNAWPNNIYQYNLNAANPSASRISIGTGFALAGDMRLAPDGKIYFGAGFGHNSLGTSSKYISRINFPDNVGLACGYQDSVPGLNFLVFPAMDIGMRRGLPNMVMMPVPAGEAAGIVSDTIICLFPPVYQLLATAGTAFEWDNGSNQAQRNVTQRGTYWLRYRNGCRIFTDTFHLRGEDLPPLVLTLNNDVLSTTNSFAQYQWYKAGQLLSGAVNPILITTGNGWYSVKVSNSWGCSDSAAYQVTTTGISSPAIADGIQVYPNPGQKTIRVAAPVAVRLCLTSLSGKALTEETGKAELDISFLSSGLFLLRISDAQGHLLKVVKVTKERE